jgi:hypothetical protein
MNPLTIKINSTKKEIKEIEEKINKYFTPLISKDEYDDMELNENNIKESINIINVINNKNIKKYVPSNHIIEEYSCHVIYISAYKYYIHELEVLNYRLELLKSKKDICDYTILDEYKEYAIKYNLNVNEDNIISICNRHHIKNLAKKYKFPIGMNINCYYMDINNLIDNDIGYIKSNDIDKYCSFIPHD